MTIKEHFKECIGIHNFGHAYNDIYFFIIPLLLPLLRTEFNLTYTQAGLILTAHVGIRSLFSYISGHLGDRFDKRIIIAAGFILSSVFLASLLWANSLYGIIFCVLLMAIGVATFHPLATALVGEAAHSNHRAFHIGIFETTGALGLMLATFTFGFFVDNLGWRVTCLLIAIPGLPLAWFYLKQKKEKIDHSAVAEKNVRMFYIVLFIIGRGIRALGIGAIFSFLPTYVVEQMGLSAAVSSWVMTVFFIGGMIGSLGGGWLSDRTNPLLMITISTIIIVPLITGITYLVNTYVIFILSAGLGIMNGTFFTSQNSWLTTVSTAATRGKVLGAAFLIDGVSVTIAPTLFGWIADQIGLLGSFRWSAVPVAISILLFLKIYNLYLRQELGSKDVAL